MSEMTPQVQSSQHAPDMPPVATAALASGPAPRLRLWPAVVVIIAQWLVIVVPQWIVPGTRVQLNMMIYGAMFGAGAIGLWWLFASRARWMDRVLVLLFFGWTAVVAYFLYHVTFTFRGYGPIVHGLPLATTLLVGWLVLTPNLRWSARRIGIGYAIVAAWCYCMCLRVDGVDGSFVPNVSWRWSPTPEERFLAELKKNQTAPPSVATEPAGASLQLRPGDWAAFRGPNRDSHLTGVQIATDWKTNPPRQLWKHGIGPGWSSFCVIGERIYTQEQRGDEEAVVCYHADTGKELWCHVDEARFFETIGGPGPRATPTFVDGRLYTLGAKGNLNCLDPITGKTVWSRDILADSGRDKAPEWGFSSSPLVVHGIVMVFAGAPNGKSILGYNASTGELVWASGEGHESYSSLHLAKLDGVEQALFGSDAGLTSFNPTDGSVLWHYTWGQNQVACVAQPSLLGDSEVLFGKPGQGIRRIQVTREGNTWTKNDGWESNAIKPYYNDLVIYKDHIYGFEGNFLTCVSLADGKSRWRARGYGNGQVLLLAEQGLLLVTSEKGHVCLVEAKPESHQELARFQAVEGKTWNHPVIAHGKLFVRNGEEIACFQLTENSRNVVESPKKP